MPTASGPLPDGTRVHVERRATYFCVDIETDGPVPGLYDLVSLGAVAVVPDPARGGRLRVEADAFYREVIPTAPRRDPGAERIHGLSRAHLRAHGIPLDRLCRELADWVAARTAPGTRPVFVGHNAPFDWSFVAWAYAAAELPNPFGYKAMCTKSVTTGALGVHWFDSHKELIAERLDLPPEDAGHKHRADYDARYQAAILVRLLDHLAG